MEATFRANELARALMAEKMEKTRKGEGGG